MKTPDRYPDGALTLESNVQGILRQLDASRVDSTHPFFGLSDRAYDRAAALLAGREPLLDLEEELAEVLRVRTRASHVPTSLAERSTVSSWEGSNAYALRKLRNHVREVILSAQEAEAFARAVSAKLSAGNRNRKKRSAPVTEPPSSEGNGV